MDTPFMFVAAFGDSFGAAMLGLNPIPAVLLAVLVGFVQRRPGWVFVKSLLTAVCALYINAFVPLFTGVTPLWPDFGLMETQIQAVTLLVLSYGLIWLLAAFKQTAGMIESRRSRARALAIKIETDRMPRRLA
jgi:hypothetical protein